MKLMEKGSRMENSGTHGKFDEKLLEKLQRDYYFKLINIIHARQQDMLIYHLGEPDSIPEEIQETTPS